MRGFHRQLTQLRVWALSILFDYRLLSCDKDAMRGVIRILTVAVAMWWIGGTALAEESRTWTSKANGRQFKGTLIKVEGDSVSIRRASDNVVFKVQKASLIAADVEWIEQNAAKAAPAAPGKIEDLSALIAKIPEATGSPAVGVVLVEDGKMRGLGFSGVRKAGTEAKVEAVDKWHLGSCTKSMTATLAATFVEEGAIRWESTISEILGKDLDILEAYKDVTLGELVANRSGLPKSLPNSVYGGIKQTALAKDLKDRDLLKQRAKYAEAVLNLDPVFKPGSAYGYSNAGFGVAGTMLEKVSGKPWEKLMQERIFAPLKMTNSGFGNAAREDRRKPSQPWPHKDGKTPYDPGPGDDNPWVLGPAGTVHCSLHDAARYLAMHATRELGPVIKKAETYAFLHTALPDNNDYARGWIVTKTPWSKGPALSHSGSNTMNRCTFWVAPERKAAVAAFTNCGSDEAKATCSRAIDAVVDKYLK